MYSFKKPFGGEAKSFQEPNLVQLLAETKLWTFAWLVSYIESAKVGKKKIITIYDY